MISQSSIKRVRPVPGNDIKPAGLFRSQLVLFNSRKKWGMLYSLATVAGLFCVPGVLGSMAEDFSFFGLVQKATLLPLISLLVATGMYILNDLVDSDLDRANGKKRPIPSGQVSKRQAWIFVFSTNGAAVLLSVATFNAASMVILLPMLAIGVMYSAPRVALMNRFLIKTIAISTFYALCALLGITSSYGIDLFTSQPLVPMFSMLLLGIMIFVSSTLNDLGDTSGDKAAGRRTIPIVLGTPATMRLLTYMAAGIIVVSLALYVHVGLSAVAFATGFGIIVIWRLRKLGMVLEKMDASEIRAQHKKIFPLHMLLQLLLAAGSILFI